MNTSLDQRFIWPKAWPQRLSFMARVDFCPNVFGFESINSTNSLDFESKSVYPSCWCTYSTAIFWILGVQKTTFPKFPKHENLVTVYLDTEWEFQKISRPNANSKIVFQTPKIVNFSFLRQITKFSITTLASFTGEVRHRKNRGRACQRCDIGQFIGN